MCNGNLAAASTRYINSQLAALWANSQICNEEEVPGEPPRDDVVKRGIAFREFFGPLTQARDSNVFHAVFGTPRMEFLCDHEVILYLNIEDGHYNLASSPTPVVDTTLAIRLSYDIQDVVASMNGGSCIISILTLDGSSGSIVSEKSHSESDIDLDVLFQVVKTCYQPTLISGLLNLFVLPASYTSKQTIDHGVLVKSLLPREIISGTEVEKINDILNHRWLAAVYAGQSDSHELRDVFLANYTSQLDGPLDLFVDVELRALRVQVLCEQEVVLFIKGDINFWDDETMDTPAGAFKDWEVAIIFAVACQDGRIILTRTRIPRIAHNLCSLPSEDFPGLEVLREQFKRIILCDYTNLMFTYGHNQLYPDLPPPTPSPVDQGACPGKEPCTPPIRGEKPDLCNWPAPVPPLPKGPYCPGGKVTIDWSRLWDLFSTETTVDSGYHSVTTITQAGLNAHFAALWAKAESVVGDAEKRLAILLRFDSKEFDGGDICDLPHLKAEFGSPQIELLTHSGSTSVIVYFNVKKITLDTNDNCVHDYKDWILAFKFNLKFVTKEPHNDDDDLGTTASPKYRQLVLDPTSATFVHDRSTFIDFLKNNDPEVIRGLCSQLYKSFIARYISAFVEHGHNVLYTLPIAACAHIESDLDFSIVPFSLSSFGGHIFQGICGLAHHIVERNMIIFHKATQPGEKARPLLPGPYSAPSELPPHGSILLSRASFLEDQIVKPLAKVNALSTILCKLNGVSKSHWDLQFQSWQRHPLKSDAAEDCQWRTALPDTKNTLKYEWRNEEEWRYEAEGYAISNATYAVKTTTLNTLVVPTSSASNPLVIKIHGATTVQMSSDTACGQERWSGNFVATWDAPISIASNPTCGVSVHADKNVKINFEQGDIEDVTATQGFAALESAKAQFQEAFAEDPIDLSSFLDDINESLKDVFQGPAIPSTSLVLSKPVFSAQGDLVLHLHPPVVVCEIPVETAVLAEEPKSLKKKKTGLFQRIMMSAEESKNALAARWSAAHLKSTSSPASSTETIVISQTAFNQHGSSQSGFTETSFSQGGFTSGFTPVPSNDPGFTHGGFQDTFTHDGFSSSESSEAKISQTGFSQVDDFF